MAQEPKRVKILIASPSDVAAERKIVAEEIGKWNILNREIYGIELEAVMWETHAHAASGERTQGILNEQIVDQCDLAIAMFHARIGTDTSVAPGGAVEEVRRMLQQKKQVMCWFSEEPLPNGVDLDQVMAVRDFRDQMQSNALCDSYEDLGEFQRRVSYQLGLYMKKLYGLSIEAYATLQLYQEFLKREFENLNLSGSSAISAFSVALADIFVSLRLSDNLKSEERLHCELSGSAIPEGTHVRTPEKVMELVFKSHRLLLVVGDPGSGKTTLLKYYALSCLDGKHEAFGFTSPVRVFWLPLREMKRSDDGYSYGSLAVNLAQWCKRNCLDDIIPKHCAGWLEAPESLVLLDGLDEISDVTDRIELCRWIDLMVKRYRDTRFVVTSRSTGYRKDDGIEIVTPHIRADIMNFNDKQQVDFLVRWFRAAYRRELPPNGFDEASWQKMQEAKADKKVAAITVYLAEDRNKSLKTLAEVPLLLQIMALLWKENEYLPNGRRKLYDAALDYMLDYRDRSRNMVPLLSTEDARRVLAPVSLWMQEEVKRDEAKRNEVHRKMDEVLARLNTKADSVAFCKNLVDRAGVLVEYGDADYVFRHKTFREYLAAVQLDRNIRRTPGFFDDLVLHFGDDWWQEVFRFFIDLLDDAELFERFMLKLFDSQVTESLSPKRQELLLTLVREAPQKQYAELIRKMHDLNTSHHRKRYLAECLRIIGKEDALEAVRQFEKWYEGELFINPLELDAHYIPIKGGIFTYSLTKKKVTLSDFRLARYPVTNRLYQRFIDYLQTGRIDNRESLPLSRFKKELAGFAKTNGLNWLVEIVQGDNDLAGEFLSRYDDDKQFTGEEHPVVCISWYAARSYCLWLSLMESNGKETNLYRLPTEEEWEYAASGKDERIYPWGDVEPTSKHANYYNNEGATTPVGSYPEGATWEGLYDMAGNVFEWQENLYNQYKVKNNVRALRGGAWVCYPVSLHCTSRFFSPPLYRNLEIGFRVVRPSFAIEPKSKK
jgi:formylglycine-generating enzyme required for sulfatase activity